MELLFSLRVSYFLAILSKCSRNVQWMFVLNMHSQQWYAEVVPLNNIFKIQSPDKES